jgi:hypothetical protein
MLNLGDRRRLKLLVLCWLRHASGGCRRHHASPTIPSEPPSLAHPIRRAAAAEKGWSIPLVSQSERKVIGGFSTWCG